MTVNKKKEKGEYEEQISTLILKICLSLTNEKKDEHITDRRTKRLKFSNNMMVRGNDIRSAEC